MKLMGGVTGVRSEENVTSIAVREKGHVANDSQQRGIRKSKEER